VAAQFSHQWIAAQNLSPLPEAVMQVVSSSCPLLLHEAFQMRGILGISNWCMSSHAVPADTMKNLRTAPGCKTMIPCHSLWLPACIGQFVSTTLQE
jgi:hypothetical protein